MEYGKLGLLAWAVMVLAGCSGAPAIAAKASVGEGEVEVIADRDSYAWPIQMSEQEWRKILTPEQFRILRQQGTEPACFITDFGPKEEGVYVVAGIGVPVFHSRAKYKSGSGWPAYFEPISRDAVKFITDYSHGMVRTEVVDAQSGSHLGHVFPDGPEPSGLRYCINSAALEFIPQAEWERMQAEQAAADSESKADGAEAE